MSQQLSAPTPLQANGEMPRPVATSATRVEKLLSEALSIGQENVAALDEELKQARAAVRTAVEQYQDARHELNERFDALARVLEETRARVLSDLDASYNEQEQRITFDVEGSKAQRRSILLAMSQAKDAAAAMKVPDSPRKYSIAPPENLAEETAEKLAHIKAALEVPVRHIRGVRVKSGAETTFDAAAKVVRGLAVDARAEPTLEEPRSRHIRQTSGPLSALSVTQPRPAPLAYRQNDRRFLVLSAASEKRALDVCGKLRGAVGRCVIDNVRANESLASLDDLSGYDAVLVWVGGCTGFAGGTVLGSVLARYVAAGGGVVVCPWALAPDDDGDGLRGEIVDSGLLGTFLGECVSGSRLVWRRTSSSSSGDYDDPVREPTPSLAAASQTTSATPGATASPLVLPRRSFDLNAAIAADASGSGHPLMWGVRYIDGGAYSGHHALRVSEDRPGLIETAAMWDDGTPLAIVSKSALEGGRYTTAVINLYPVSSDYSVRCWDTQTDFAVLLTNALHLVARH